MCVHRNIYFPLYELILLFDLIFLPQLNIWEGRDGYFPAPGKSHHMQIRLAAAGIAVAALIPSFAMAQQSCEQRRTNQAVGTIAGAGIGALLGSAVAGHGDRTAGAVVGGLGGAVVGNQLSKAGADCAHAYGYYDGSGAWHASTVSRQDARGYFDREGAWIDGPPA